MKLFQEFCCGSGQGNLVVHIWHIVKIGIPAIVQLGIQFKAIESRIFHKIPKTKKFFLSLPHQSIHKKKSEFKFQNSKSACGRNELRPYNAAVFHYLNINIHGSVLPYLNTAFANELRKKTRWLVALKTLSV